MSASDEGEVFHDALHEAGLHHAAATSELVLHHDHDGVAVAELDAFDEGDVVVVANSTAKRPYDETNVGANANYEVVEPEAKRQKAEDALGIPKKGNSSWDAMFEKLVAYKDQNGGEC